MRDLRTQFYTEAGIVRAVDGLSFNIRRGETLGVVGESGSGKSVTFLSVMGLVRPPGQVVGGEVIFKDVNLRSLPERKLRQLRGRDIAMIFQDPLTGLNPVFTIGRQITDVIRAHTDLSRKEARERAIEMLSLVQIPRAAERIDDHPFEFSGGMRQRVIIAMALSLRPALLIADEPTTALDVTTQAQILELLAQLSDEMQMATVIITHDMGVVAGRCGRIAVMYAGRIVEQGDTNVIFRRPRHPYTVSLLRSVPGMDRDVEDRLPSIPGSPPRMVSLPSGCSFHPRCFLRQGRDVCRESDPALRPCSDDPAHVAACHFREELRDVGFGPTMKGMA